MKIISDVPGHREVELTDHEARQRDYIEELLDRGFNFRIAFKYAAIRFGVVTGELRRWIAG